MAHDDQDEDLVWFSIPLNGATVDRLMNLSNLCHAEPVRVAASLLHDILKEDDLVHDLEPGQTDHGKRLN